MKAHHFPFMGEEATSSFHAARIVVLPFPYEGGVSFGKGTSSGPDAILKASAYVELYDELLRCEPHREGIFTALPTNTPGTPEGMIDTLHSTLRELINQDKFVVLLGGDHSISSAYARALQEKFGRISVIQFDAHADLRDSYEGSRLSHACVMSRIREMTNDTLQIGVRSLSVGEAGLIETESIQVCMMSQLRDNTFDIRRAIEMLPDPVFVTFDVDVFDWSVVRSTGTPEPGGMTWDEVADVLQMISSSRCVAGFDVVELIDDSNDPHSAFAVAKLAYRMMGMFAVNQAR